MTTFWESARMRIVGRTLLPGGELRLALVALRNGLIDEVSLAVTRPEERAIRRTPGAIRLRSDEVLAPAYVDVHCHGAGGGAAAGGTEALARMATTLLNHGVGGFLATFQTDALPALREAALAAAERMANPGAAGSTVLGVHLEGPALSRERSAGHDPTLLIDGSALCDAIFSDPGAWRAVRLVTLAPELPGGSELVRRLVGAGIAVSVGHTDASTEVASAAYSAGARSTTHLFNAMPPLHHREPGPVGAALAHAPFIEFIADGVHVDSRLLAPIGRAIGADRLVLVTDALPLAGSRLRRVLIPGSVAVVRNGVAVLPDGGIAGGRLLLDGVVHSAVRAGIPLSDALCGASENPARLLGLVDRGAIRVGARADLVIVTLEGHLRRVVVASA
jgi:N-acetylglucosamine-6-phosphate deacetylase